MVSELWYTNCDTQDSSVSWYTACDANDELSISYHNILQLNIIPWILTLVTRGTTKHHKKINVIIIHVFMDNTHHKSSPNAAECICAFHVSLRGVLILCMIYTGHQRWWPVYIYTGQDLWVMKGWSRLGVVIYLFV